ncbi:MAG: cbb3-type cytochrome c oxidase subunit I, partial [Pseudomonadota bacterium]
HFHNVIIGGVVFGIFAGINYWFPKAFGFRLDPFWGKLSFWGWLIGFYLAFMPLYVLGLMGVTRRLSQFQDTAYSAYFVVAAVGAVFVAFGIVAFLVQLYVSIRDRHSVRLRDVTGDPWGGRTLEWSTTSPPPYYNFAFTPRVYELDAWDHMKRHGYRPKDDGFVPIHMPHYTATGVVLSALMTVMGFALVWHIWWLAALSFLASLGYGIAHTFNYDRDYYVPGEEVHAIEAGRLRVMAGPAE